MEIEKVNSAFNYLLDEYEENKDFILSEVETSDELLDRLVYLHVNLFKTDSEMKHNLVALILSIEKLFTSIQVDAQDLYDRVYAFNHVSKMQENTDDELAVSTKNTGYIYVLINPSMRDLVKIGKTTRDPEDRVNELSSVTGVPTPFTLVYKEYFEDCSRAEYTIHTLLEEKGYRLSDKREFFNIPVHKAIKIIQEFKNEQHATLESGNSEFEDIREDSADNLIDALLKEADDYIEGYGNKLQNTQKGIMSLHKAAKLDSARAYKILGQTYLRDDLNDVKPNIPKAIEYLLEGTLATGYEKNQCFAEMAMVYSGKYNTSKSDYTHKFNATKSWDDYFTNFSLENAGFDDKTYMSEYLVSSMEMGWEINKEYNMYLSLFLPDIYMTNCRQYKSYSELLPHLATKYLKAINYLKDNFEHTIDYSPALLNEKVGYLRDLKEINNKEISLSVELISGSLKIDDVICIASFSELKYANITSIVVYGEEVDQVESNTFCNIIISGSHSQYYKFLIDDASITVEGKYTINKRSTHDEGISKMKMNNSALFNENKSNQNESYKNEPTPFLTSLRKKFNK
ncbi:GIY-YIG nuclease family protein [Sutcliffiella horikoshii]|uniref:GIY-YIG nuclease family protein n=1 Tax=Sutcliffiella horikoshii TaxID=79883 RepID=UPI00384F7635